MHWTYSTDGKVIFTHQNAQIVVFAIEFNRNFVRTDCLQINGKFIEIFKKLNFHMSKYFPIS